MHKFLATAGLSLLASPALAICSPPYQAVFACDIAGSERRVEVCGVPSEADANYMMAITFFSAVGKQPPDVFFKTAEAIESTYKYWETRRFNGVAYGDGGRLYAIYASGSFETGALYQGMVEIFDSQEAFDSPEPDQQTVRWECADGTLHGYSYTYFAP